MADSGPRFGRYRLQGRIAAGGMGEVFRATAQAFDGVQKRVAIKLIRTGLEGDPNLVKMFVEEAKVAFLLTHANLVQTFDVGTIDGQYFLAMEYVEGMTLSQVLKGCRDVLGQPMPQRHAVFIAVETLKGLHYAHRFRDGTGRALAIVHRDVSPSNILISREGEVKVSDFGIAWSTMKTHRSMLGTIKGKVPYMPPEQVRGTALDARADVYAVGAVLYETLCGRPSFLGPPGTIIPLVIEGRFPHPRELDPNLPAELERIVLRAMAPDASARYDSASAMRDDLEELAMRQIWRLSSSDLASFVGALDVPAPASDGARAGAFDQALGEELRKVGEGQALSVFTSVALRPSADSLEPRRSEPADPTHDTTPERPAVAVHPVTDPGPVRPWVEGPGVDDSSAGRASAAPAFPAPAASSSSSASAQSSSGGSWEPESAESSAGLASERPRRRIALYALYGAALVVVALVGALAARSDEHGRGGASAGDAASAPGPAAGGPTVPLPPVPAGAANDWRGPGPTPAPTPSGAPTSANAGSPPPVLPVLPVGVEPPAGPAVGGPDGAMGRPPPNDGFAVLLVNTEPWTFVEIDGVRLGPTPQRQRIRAGRHVLRFTNPAKSISRSQAIVLREGEVRRIVLELAADHGPGR